LFSSLVDADWLDTESHFEPEKTAFRKQIKLNYSEFIDKINKHIQSLPKNGEINRLRSTLRDYALSKEEGEIGFYSLNLPTGMGKTLTSVHWALLHARKNSLDRIIIVLPYINIIDQTVEVLRKIFGENEVLEHHSAFNEEYYKDDENQYNQHKLACENWDYPVIVTTTVQFFESLFSNRPSRCRKIHHIATAVVIFDEVQTLPMEIILPTLQMLKDVCNVMKTSFLFCTATQPAFVKREGFDGIDRIISLVEKPAEIFSKTKRVLYHVLEQMNEIDMKTLIDHLGNHKQSILVIFNTKRDTYNFFETACNKIRCDVYYHLSTNMCPSHRRKKISHIKKDLKDGRKILVASTQLIEAGVDFDFPVVYRAVAPLESIIQSAGRCNREGKMPQKGSMYIFNLKDMGMPCGTYKKGAELVKMLITHNPSQLEHYDFFDNYYRQMIGQYVNPDRHNINKARKKFLFKTVSNSYRIIDSDTYTLFIPDYDEESLRVWDSIKNKPFISRDDYRRMQQYSVAVFRNIIEKYSHCISCDKNKNLYIWTGKYDPDTGIIVEDISIDELIV
jgi:CRISPR-associated endonuclease/helicase Cas3